ncbi:MAG: SUF system Fe-S cluster assembly protein [Crocinitomicaceae bacterium]|nr:SUF system Fe-S cluster assembly protein [Crocinitomicaceae bacterium]PDH48776.1 MAG: SUF system Fe-S cluster assembly protein [Bacteroidetes bacterium MED-G20]RPG79183.1 MAG: SUF system Fe-S cluster assembly protein [Crocinitomicaceae bacterium TMED135]|tara:strand:+ start:526 stop:861 length:336 start_codon:yes stop_codon:yes gene_type:complete
MPQLENLIGDKKKIENKIINVLKAIFDPEIPVDIYELGLIYEIKIDDQFHTEIIMTLTSPNCPVAESMPKEVEDKVGEVHGVKSSKVNIVFDPPWDKDMMSEEAKLDLGMI